MCVCNMYICIHMCCKFLGLYAQGVVEDVRASAAVVAAVAAAPSGGI